MSSFTAITETSINDITAPYGDQNVLDSLNTFGSKESQIQSIQHLPPNSQGDYCGSIFENKHDERNENKLMQHPTEEQFGKPNHDILNEDSCKEIHVEEEREVRNSKSENLVLKQIEFRRHIKTIEKLDQIIKSDDPMVIAESTLKPLQENYSEIKDTNDMENNFANRIQTGKSDKFKDDHSKNTSNDNEVVKDLPGKVNTIIRRVEHVYSQLEDIQLMVSLKLY